MKVLLISDSPTTPSGFGIHGNYLAQQLLKWGFEVIYHGLQNRKDQMINTTYGSYKVYRNEDLVTKGRQMFGVTNLPSIISEEEPDIVLTIMDLHMIAHVKQVKYPTFQVNVYDGTKMKPLDLILKKFTETYNKVKEEKQFHWVGLLPVDGIPVPLHWKEYLPYIDTIVAMSKWGQQVLNEYNKKHQIDKEVHYIPHGIDTKDFYPNRKRVDEGEVFVVGQVNRNQHRKQIPRTIEAFKLFVEQEELSPKEARLVLYMDAHDPMGWDLDFLCETYGLKDYVKLPPASPLYDPLPTERMNDLYNLFDVFFSSTGGEGFGLTTLEAMSCGIPVCITDYTTSRELIMDKPYSPRGKLIRVKDWYWDTPERCGNKRALIDTKHGARLLSEFYHKNGLRKKYGRNGRRHAEEVYDWSIIGKQWKELLESI